jgi:signal transduction histidine kinase
MTAGVAGRLSLGLLAVVVGVLAIVYLIVVPSYRHSLEQSELRTLAADLHAAPTPANPAEWATEVAERTGARAVVFDTTATPAGVLVTPFADSNTSSRDEGLASDPVAARAAESRAIRRGIVHRDNRSWAEVADGRRVRGQVLLLVRPFDDQPVDVVRRRTLWAGALAVGFTVLLGYLGASLFAQRIRRLEAAAERIAAGDFDEPVVDAGSDELAQLARTFERMRLRLAQLDRARGAFIANASHELRTPLFSLAGFLELLDDPDLDDATRAEFQAQTREQVARLTKLATDLLDLSRLDAGRMSVAHEELDLGELADELVSEFAARATVSGHRLEAEGEGVVLARGDAERVLQIGRVLVDNALVHTPAGVRIVVRAALDGGRATLAVADDGPGIPPEARNHVFERFFRVAGGRAAGSGLGLAIARELAEVMDGRLELVASDDGTCFSLALPAVAFSRENASLA